MGEEALPRHGVASKSHVVPVVPVRRVLSPTVLGLGSSPTESRFAFPVCFWPSETGEHSREAVPGSY